MYMCLCECVCAHVYSTNQIVWTSNGHMHKIVGQIFGASKLLFTYVIKISLFAAMFPIPANNRTELLLS